MLRTLLIIIAGTIAFLFQLDAGAQEVAKLARAVRPPLIDGLLDDATWRGASVFSDFKTMLPEAGLSPSEKTEVYLAYDAENIYVGFRCFDSEPAKIKAAASEKDNPASDDWIAFCLDTFDDHLGAHFFLVNPRGVQSDGTLDGEGSPDFTFNSRWSSAAKLTDEGYSAELSIPVRSLPFQWKKNVRMGFKVARLISRKSEEVDFPAILPDRGSHLSQFQKIELSGIARGRTARETVDVNRKYLAKLKAGSQHDTATLDGRCRAWGDAAVIDYLLFPRHDMKAANETFHFRREPRNRSVASIFEGLEYAEGKRIENFEQFLTRTRTAAFIVIHRDRAIYEKYFNGHRRDSIVTSFSVAKSIASTLVGIAIDEGLIADARDPITKYLPELKARDERFSRITIRDLLSMSSGIRYEEDPPHRDDEITYYHPDLRKAALEETKIIEGPGAHFLYNNYNPLLIGMILERATGKSVAQYLEEKIWKPLGMQYTGSWSIDSEARGFEKMESGVNARAIDFAKLGRLFLNNGRWGARQIVSSRWVEEATQPGEAVEGYYPQWGFFRDGYYKYFWWGRKRAGGRSDFFGMGNRGQYIYISPQKDLIIVRNGIEYGTSSMRWPRLFSEFADRIQ